MTSTEQIKEKIDIVDFIRSYIALLPAGKNFKANCPFHKEKTPSFIVSPERQTWHCFGACSEGGDVFKFLMKYENLEFHEALKILAEKAGIELRHVGFQEQKQFGVLYEINESAKDFFKKELYKNQKALNYLKERGLKKEIIEEFEIGLAPSGYDNLTVYLIKSGCDVKDIERAGLNFKTDRGGYIDRFRNRIMFPIYNHFGKTIGFSGRILPEFDTGEAGKYVNSPETPIFNKSKILYGFYKTKNFIRELKSAVLVEGQMDFLMMYQDGVKNAAAASGTALTPDHLKVLRRQTDFLIFCFDNDEAGLKAAEKSIDLAHNEDFNVKVLVIDKYKDPAEAVLKEPGLMKKLIGEAKQAMEFYFQRYKLTDNKRSVADNGIGELKNNLRIVLGKIKNLTSAVEKFHWLKKLSEIVGIKEEVLADEMTRIKSADERRSVSAVQFKSVNLSVNQPLSRRELISQRILVLISIRENLRAAFAGYFDYLSEDYLKIVESLINKTKLEDKRLADLLFQISLKSSLDAENENPEKIINEFNDLLRRLKDEYLKEKKEKLAREIKIAEAEGNNEKVASILSEFDEISKLS